MKTDTIRYKGLDQAQPCEPMSRESSEMFIRLTMGENGRGDTPPAPGLLAILMEHPFLRTITDRIKWAGIEDWTTVLNPEALVMLASLNTSDRFGNAVMWAYTVLYWRAEEGEPLTMNLLAQRFPMGFPTQEAIGNEWDKQKGHVLGIEDCDNFLDRLEWWHDLVEIITGERPAVPEPREPAFAGLPKDDNPPIQ